MKMQERPPPGPSFMSEPQMSESARPVQLMNGPPRPSNLRHCVQASDPDLQASATAHYLKDLRTNKPRPTGSRPQPPSRFGTLLRRAETDGAGAVQTGHERPPLPQSSSLPTMPGLGALHQRSKSSLGINSPFVGRPIARPPPGTPGEEKPESADEISPLKRTPSAVYLESGTRWMEKQETKSLRQALEDMDLADEQRVHHAAQDEAADLVWKHQNPHVPYENSETPRDYRSHLRKGSYNRSFGQDAVPIAVSRTSSGGSIERMAAFPGTSDERTISDAIAQTAPPKANMPRQKSRTPSGKSYGDLAEMVKKDVADARRRTSSGSRRALSGEKRLYMHPNDKIWEDPQDVSTPPHGIQNIPDLRPAASAVVPSYVRKNPFARVRMQQERLERSNSAPVLSLPMKRETVEIQRNVPSQSRNPGYTSNEPFSSTPRTSLSANTDDAVSAKSNTIVEHKEVRSDDIRAATSKLRKDRSQHLPEPTVVSDKPGRPIVSFRKDWRPKEIVLEEVHSKPSPDQPKHAKSISPESSNLGARPTAPPKPPIPTIHLPDESPAVSATIPIIQLPDEPVVPTIVLPEEPDFASSVDHFNQSVPAMDVQAPASVGALPTIKTAGPHFSTSSGPSPLQRPLPNPNQNFKHAFSSPLPKSTPHYSPSIRQSGAQCAHCALPIAGRVLSAAGERFHPSCFVCHGCHTNLELVAFYPEPDTKRDERLERIQARQNGGDVHMPDGMSPEAFIAQEVADGDESLRFYCHLDFHELFSPRCKSCKTPIEGEVVVACGAEWHVGHFFCAQCGDPFDSKTPFVEKDGYAWCVGCHTNRFSSKCRKCRKPVTDVVVKALGTDWHGACFCCMVSTCLRIPLFPNESSVLTAGH